MAIVYDEINQAFNLMTPETSYIIRIEQNKIPVHVYYGKRTENLENVATVSTWKAKTFSANNYWDTMDLSTDTLAQEYSFYGVDSRTPSFHAHYQDGSYITQALYEGYKIYPGKPALQGLPATYTESDSEADTLELYLVDTLTKVKITLRYTVFNTLNAMTRSVIVSNNGEKPVQLNSVLSCNIDFADNDFDLVHLHGAWIRERHIQRIPLMNGYQGFDSKRGSSSHHHSPFLSLARKNADEENGEVYGFSLVYSGNFTAGVEVDQQNMARVLMGINPFNFNWKLSPGEDFTTPEVVMVYSDAGFGKMSRTYHKLYRTRLCRGQYRDIEHPILINNWEGTRFNFNEEKILAIAKKAKSVGVELMVLDDGWFGHRDDDKSSLGDWYTDRRKLPNGIDGLAKKVTALGMRFGLWFEPEMVSPDSDLYRAHPDWCLHVADRERSQSRHQLILDLSREDVCKHIIKAIGDVLSSAPITYVKWDMNRNMTEIGSAQLDATRQPEVAHRYMLGLYNVLETLTKKFPQVLFEGCSGGGGRFDAGMLPYFSQYWTSDDSDAIERLYIQYGTSMVMPALIMSAHVSASPNHQVGRVTPLETRGDVAMLGQFGYELDMPAMTEEEISVVKEQISRYKEIRSVVHFGEMYRLRSPFEGNNMSMEFISQDQTTVVVAYCTVLGKPSPVQTGLKLQGLDADAVYIERESKLRYGGALLMNIGITMQDSKDFTSKLMIFDKQ